VPERQFERAIFQWVKIIGNISGANQPLRANYENSNLCHRINIQGRGAGEVEGRICKSPPALGLGNHTFANLPSHLPCAPPLDIDPVVQIEVCIVYTERLVCT